MILAVELLVDAVAVIVLAHGVWWTLLSVVALPRPRTRKGSGIGLRITVIVPAHDEAALIGACVDSLLAASSLPTAEVLVVADNCEDRTAEIARAHGATVIERSDPERRGKGFALDFAIAALRGRAQPPQVVAFVDADSTVSTNFFAAVTQQFVGGAEAVQVHYVPTAAESPLGKLRGLALSLVHFSRPLGAHRLRLGTTLKGNGMAMTWTRAKGGLGSDGITEDAAMTLALAQRGVRVQFVPGASVQGYFAQGYDAARTQDERWEGGRLALLPRALATALRCLRRRSLSCAAAAFEVASLPLSLLAALSVLAAALAALGIGSLGLAFGAALSLGTYLVVGWSAARVPPSSVLALFFAPRFVLYKLAIYARLASGGPRDQWKRTDRT